MMSNQILKDTKGFKLGSITTDSNGKQTIYDKSGFRKGVYDPKSNITKDSSGFKFGTGNLLTKLL